jgi:hypothetical protein
MVPPILRRRLAIWIPFVFPGSPGSYFNRSCTCNQVAESKEVEDFDELRRLRLADEGYLVITDKTRHSIVHKINAKCITADSFNLKVKINGRRQGSYFWVDGLPTAAREFGAKRCKVCKPEFSLVLPSTFE